MTFLRDIAIAPLARLTVTIIGSISGVRPTATATANSSASSQLPLVRPLITNTSGAITTMKPSISQVNRVMPLSKLVSTRCLAMALATRPKAVRGPVSTTTPQPMPLTTALPMKQMLARSNGVSAAPAWAAATFSSGIASPVSADWLTNRSFAEISRDRPGSCRRPTAARCRRARAARSARRRGLCVSRAAAPAHRRGDRHHPLQLVGGVVGTMFLDEAQRDAQDHHDGDHDRGALIAEEIGRRRQRQQEQRSAD